MHYSIDRFEGEYAVCEDENGVFRDIPKALMPEDAREGSVIAFDGENGCFVCDDEQERCKRDRTNDLQRSLWDDQRR